ncbi:TerD family protein [Klenkia sp. PcliD-1-E]|uniref:TerD family protein n=1 Tax=Klenkia sp. PcliD-1-E TaxID=2954492 RepID=UPI00209857CE|nr:TerD family protein [Klenkia sp. PcliD-1-E]MCO7219383.1 TerD family protein [Klenkia sp. PcliD-1-E]
MRGTELSKGANSPLPIGTPGVRCVVSWGRAEVEVDASALLLDGAGKVRGDEDLVFYNQPTSSDGGVRHLGGSRTDDGGQESVAVDLESLPDDVAAVAVAASVATGTLADVEELALVVMEQDGQPLVFHRVLAAEAETAMVLGEVYRRNGAWRIRAVAQGWATGLAGLATDLGVAIDDEVTDETAEDVPSEMAIPSPPATGDVRTDHDDEVAVVELDPDGAGPRAIVVDRPPAQTTPAAPTSPAARPGAGLRTRKQPVARFSPPVLKLAGGDGWTAARLFSISGVGNAAEQEKRATSALLATMMAVKPFGRGLTARFGAPAGVLETYLEVPFHRGEAVVVPDGVLRVQRGARLWTALLETKTGTGQLRTEQVENYLDVAKREGFDAVITLSNEIAPGVGEHPVAVDRRKLAKVALFHLSWAEVLHEAQMVLSHRGVADAGQAWLLHEFLRYVEHPRSGAAGFNDMGPSWVPVREAVAAGTLRPGDRKVPAAVDAWIRLVRQLCLRLTAELGVDVAHVMPRKLATDPAARTRAGVETLAASGRLEATLRVPGAAGPLDLVADLRTGQVTTSTRVSAPQEGTNHRRIAWLVKQLTAAPADLLVEADYAGETAPTCEQLQLVRTDHACLSPVGRAPLVAFNLARSVSMGTKRSGVRGAFIPSVVSAVESFYSDVVQPVRPWVARAPRLPEDPADVPDIDPEPAAELDRA